MPDAPLLWHFPISHFNEKVRWALDWKRVPHRREVLSGDYVFRVWWATGRRSTLPVLHLEGRAIVDSTAILAALEQRWPEPPLYPADPAERERALALEDWLDDDVGHPVRTLVIPSLMEEGPERIGETLMHGMDPRLLRIFRFIHPVFQRFYYTRHAIGHATREAAPTIVREAYDRLEAERAGRDYLVGDRFSVADLTAAAILAPLVRPAGSLWAELGAYPDPVERFLAPLDAHPTTRWVRALYARHRGESQEI